MYTCIPEQYCSPVLSYSTKLFFPFYFSAKVHNFVKEDMLLSSAEFADWVQRSVQAISLLEKQELQ